MKQPTTILEGIIILVGTLAVLWAIANFGNFLLWIRGRKSPARELEENGVNAPAEIVEVQEGMVNTKVSMHMTVWLKVYPPSGAPFETVFSGNLRKPYHRFLSAGLKIEVRYDPGNLKNIDIVLNSIPIPDEWKGIFINGVQL